MTPEYHREYSVYYRIARHYKWALTQIFDVLHYDQVVVVEDDLEVSPDFFEYFKATLPVLQQDDTLMCVTAWNDNGQKGLAYDPRALYRSDFFGGLGWMMLRPMWNELNPVWPDTYWDDWLRNPDRHHGRGCIRPEVSRTQNFGKGGASGELYSDYVSNIIVGKATESYVGVDDQLQFAEDFDFASSASSNQKTMEQLISFDVRRLLKNNYDDVFMRQVYKLSALTTSDQLFEILKSEDPMLF